MSVNIRREDKEIVQYLALLGMLFGAVIAIFVLLNQRQQALCQLQNLQQSQMAHQRISMLSSNIPAEQVKLAENLLHQVQTNSVSSKPLLNSFWSELSKPRLLALMGLAGLIGGISGYFAFGVAGWLGSFFTYWLIRRIYRLIGGAKPTNPVLPPASYLRRDPNDDFIVRDPQRTLPMVIKLLVLLTCLLTAIGMIIWRLTAI